MAVCLSDCLSVSLFVWVSVLLLARDVQAKLALIVAQIYPSVHPSVHLSVWPRQLESMGALYSSKFCSKMIISFFPKLVQGTLVWYIFGLFHLFLIN